MASTLDALTRKHPDLAGAAATLRALTNTIPYPALPRGVPHLGAVEIRLASGIPALEGEPLLSDPSLLANVRLLAATLDTTASLQLHSVVEFLDHIMISSDGAEVALAAQTGTWDLVRALAERSAVDPDAAIVLVDHASRPALRAGAEAVQQLIAQSRWARGTCPACGAPPLLGELRGGGAAGSAEHERVLRCGRCASAWSYPRLRCVACGETNHRQLAYLHAEGEESFRRAEVCSACHCYVKTVAVLAPLDAVELLAADLATTPLDVAAVERGFHR